MKKPSRWGGMEQRSCKSDIPRDFYAKMLDTATMVNDFAAKAFFDVVSRIDADRIHIFIEVDAVMQQFRGDLAEGIGGSTSGRKNRLAIDVCDEIIAPTTADAFLLQLIGLTTTREFSDGDTDTKKHKQQDDKSRHFFLLYKRKMNPKIHVNATPTT